MVSRAPLFQKDFKQIPRVVSCPQSHLHRLASVADLCDWFIFEGEFVQCNHCVWDETKDLEIYANTTEQYKKVCETWSKCTHSQVRETQWNLCQTCHILWAREGVTEKEILAHPKFIECSRLHFQELRKLGYLESK